MRFQVVILSLSILSGCASSNTEKDFLCRAQLGAPCTTIGAVDGTGTEGLRSIAEHPEDTAAKSLSQAPLWAGKNAVMNFGDGGSPYNAGAYRSAEIVGTLWIAPILDEDGILNEARFVHFVIQEGRWKS